MHTHEDADALGAGTAGDEEHGARPNDGRPADAVRYAARREGECDVARRAAHGDEAPWASVLAGTIWEWWARTTRAREDYLDGLPSTLTRQERDFVLERFEMDRPFNAMPLDEVARRREHDEVFGIRYAEFLHRTGMSLTTDGMPDARTDGKSVDDVRLPRP